MAHPSTPKTVKAPAFPPPVSSKRQARLESTVPAVSRQMDSQVDDDPFVEPGGPSKTSWATEEDIERNRNAMYAQAVMRVFHQDGRLHLGSTTRQAPGSWQPRRNAPTGIPTGESSKAPAVPAAPVHRDRLIGKSVSSPAILEPPVSSSGRRVPIPAPVRPDIQDINTGVIDRLRMLDRDTLLSASWKEVERIVDQIEAEQREEESRSSS